MIRPVDVIVAIPAHHEEELLPGCLDHALEAVRQARSEGCVGRAVVSVAAHHCTDRTAEVARLRLASAPPGVEWVVLEDRESATVAEVRRTAVNAAVPLLADTAGAWLFNTDADSLVPPGWITEGLQVAAREQAEAVAGLVEVQDWTAGPLVRRAYDALVARGIHRSGHDHAYGANLAVGLRAYRSVGGFTPLPHGEDHDLLRRLRAAGFRVATPLSPRVATSGREDPRCPDGLGALLHRIAEAAEAG